MTLEVDEHYLTASGEIVKIDEMYVDTIFNIKDLYYYDKSENAYFKDGKCAGNCREFDLIAHIPKKLHWYIIDEIRLYNTREHDRIMIDEAYDTRNLSLLERLKNDE